MLFYGDGQQDTLINHSLKTPIFTFLENKCFYK